MLTPTNGNLYHYAANNPVKYTDPDGRSSLYELRIIAKTIKATGKAGNRDIHFSKHLRVDGCFARACIIADYLREKGYKC